MSRKLHLRRVELPIDLIDFFDHQFRFRKDFDLEDYVQLADNIKENGQLNASKVRKKNGKYQIIAGWKRAYAVRYLGDRPLVCDVYYDMTDEQAYRINIADNELRDNLTPTELAQQVSHLRDIVGFSVEQIAEMHNCGIQRVYDLLKLSQMPEEVQDAVHKNSITLYHAIELEKIPFSKRLDTLHKAIGEGWSVRRIHRERLNLNHPFIDTQKLAFYFLRKDTWHAFRFRRTPDTDRFWKRHWELISKNSGVPAPLKCEFTRTIPAKLSRPPYVCNNDIKWVVLSSNDLPSPRARKGIKRIYERNIPLEERDGWFFWCERCVRLTFPNCNFHHDKIYRMSMENY